MKDNNIQHQSIDFQLENLSILIISEIDEKEIIEHIQKLGISVDQSVGKYDRKKLINSALIEEEVQSLGKEIHLVLIISSSHKSISVAVQREISGDFQILNFHQLSAIITDLITKENQDPEAEMFRSFRTSDLLNRIATKNGNKCNIIYQSLNEDDFDLKSKNSLMYINDKQEFHTNHSNSLLQLIELIVKEEAVLRNEKKTIFDKLVNIYQDHGFYKEKALTIKLQNKIQHKYYQKLIDKLRVSKAETIFNGSTSLVTDFKKPKIKNIISGKKTELEIKPFIGVMVSGSNGSSLAMELKDDQLNYHISVRGSMTGKGKFEELDKSYTAEIVKLVERVNRL